MNYAHILSNKEAWSYSSITTFEDCRYRFLLKYVYKIEETGRFYSEYGSFLHRIIQSVLCGALPVGDAPLYYISHFREAVPDYPQNEKIFGTYFRDGLNYTKNMQIIHKPDAIEEKYSFQIDGVSFVGIVDWISTDEKLRIIDNKSRALKPRSNRKSPTKTDLLLDKYFRQLYIYSIPVAERYGRQPDELLFNCFRTQTVIREPYRESAFQNAKDFALRSVDTIINNESWEPNLDWFSCKYICGVSEHCEYCQMAN